MPGRPVQHLRAAPKRACPPRPGAWSTRRPRGPARRQLRALCRNAGSLLPDWELIREGDRVLAALSGGKDSAAMLEVLLELRHRAPVRFDVGAVVVDPGFRGFHVETVAQFAQERGVETWVIRADIEETLESLGWKRSPCALCSRLRRGVLYRVATELGFGTLALGHNADDAIETALMNIFLGGQLRAMAPRYQPREKQAPAVIRPLLSTFEHEILAYARARAFRLVDSACPLGQGSDSERQAVKHLVAELAADHPRVRQSALAALGNVSPGALMDRSLQRRLELVEAEGQSGSRPWSREPLETP